jgi:succinate-semialdehyde dehydrogenase/glutarate-semialdehyde dehydrogenase
MYKVINPATGDTVTEFDTIDDAAVIAAVDSAAAGFTEWAARSVADRAAITSRVADLFEERIDALAAIMTVEMGKRPAEGKGELETVASIFRYYADNADKLLEDQQLDIVGGTATIRRRPLGVILGIMPWNYPTYQVARFVAPNLVLGNSMLLKHASNCPLIAQAIETLLHDAGVPKNVYINLFVETSQIEQIIAHPAVQGVSLTGSERAGSAVAEIADPMIVLDSQDIAETARIAAESRLSNAGQACNAPKRMIVLADIYDDFVSNLVTEVERYQIGDPADPAVTMAPLSSRGAAEAVAAQIQVAVEDGATLHTGGTLRDERTAIMRPAVLTGVTPSSRAYDDEIFGPVAIVFRAETIDDAVTLANDSSFGLGSSVFSADIDRAREVGARIDAGMVYVNQAGGSQADLPFGGIKRSGIGRELGALGIDEFANKMTIRHG